MLAASIVLAGICGIVAKLQWRQSTEALASLKVTPETIPSNGSFVSVTWANVSFAGAYDWIGLYDSSVLQGDGSLPWPMKFKTVGGKGNGSVDFFLPSRSSSSFVFYYVSGASQYPELKAQSNIVSVLQPELPFRVRLAFSNSGGLYVIWQQRSGFFNGNPMARWWSVDVDANGATSSGTAKAVSRTFDRDDLCDRNLRPAARNGWQSPGVVLWAEIPGGALIRGARYNLQAGDTLFGFSEVMQFTSPPAPSPFQRVKLIAFGDMGTTSWGVDHAHEFSWDFDDRGEIPTLNTSKRIKAVAESDGADFVLHFGDISYAVGALANWDEWLELIRPITEESGLPWMASIGNHEYGWSKSDWTPGKILETATDSGGECGVPFITYFPYAQQFGEQDNQARKPEGNKLPHAGVCSGGECSAWYAFDYGSVHFTMISTEQDLTVGSSQWTWLRQDLASVNRSITPWLVVTGHRPIQVASTWQGDLEIATYLTSLVGDLFVEFNVDVFWAGHHHSYQRFDPVDKSEGYVPFVMGMAGYENSKVDKSFPGLVTSSDDTWGLTHWDFQNATHARGRYMSNQNGTLDDFWIVRPFPRGYTGSSQAAGSMNILV
eukprot:gnl/MRDRNA2_/MRDRNA2_14579_c0_seq1.p1 gnl/MRDRNA2_/MRDRNA2_14579_c0~~gnl/MRDRNA2_/MRDRNA2_14579_c0_seq1.p1  ORF type:complete len:620 (+),score=76.81 gnl/MRDRNA2_/MRDRNA2_14579_c0_seq1:51-1862(+)